MCALTISEFIVFYFYYYFYYYVTFVHGICNSIPETKHVSRVYCVADNLYLQFVLHVMLFRMLNMFSTFTSSSSSSSLLLLLLSSSSSSSTAAAS
jgi:hypothetical protein